CAVDRARVLVPAGVGLAPAHGLAEQARGGGGVREVLEDARRGDDGGHAVGGALVVAPGVVDVDRAVDPELHRVGGGGAGGPAGGGGAHRAHAPELQGRAG